MIKQTNQNGQKSYQRSDTEDRSLGYRNWLRTVESGGAWCDLDLIKFKGGKPTAITELTRCDSIDIPTQSYFDAITNRWYVRDGQAYLIEEASNRLGVPAYLIVFNKDILWFKIWDFQKWEWLPRMNEPQYLLWLQNL